MKKKTNKSKKANDLNFIDDLFAVANINNYSDEVTFFNLYIRTGCGNVAIYGCKVISTKEHDDFIGWPSESYKDSTGATKYRNQASILFADGMEERIIDEVARQIET